MKLRYTLNYVKIFIDTDFTTTLGFNSKLRYGLQLFGKVRRLPTDPTNQDMDYIQLVQNKLLRMITITKLSDKVPASDLLDRTNMLSVNPIFNNTMTLDYFKFKTFSLPITHL